MNIPHQPPTTPATGPNFTSIYGRRCRPVALAAAGLTVLGSSAWGYDWSADTAGNAPLGSCTVNWQISGEGYYAFMRLTTSSGVYSTAGTYYTFPVDPAPDSPAITVAAIQDCGFTNVTGLTQNGADSNYPADDYMGFSFRAVDPADGKTYDYEFAISGATNTHVITRKTLVATPAQNGSADVALIERLQSERMNQLIQNQPRLIPTLDGDGKPEVTMSAIDGTGTIESRFSAGPFWGDVTATWADTDSYSSRYVVGSVGAHHKLSDNAAIGFMAQFDHINQDDGLLGTATGNGWLAGPYAVARVPGRELYFDARALWGRSSNDITAAGQPTDSVDGNRSLLMLRASTRLDAGPWQIRPRMELARASESTSAFVDGLGVPVPSTKAAINQAAVGVAVSRDFATAAGKLNLTGALDGIWTNTTSGPDAAYEDGRARLSFGLNYVTDSAGTLSANLFADGLAQDGYEARGLSIAYNLRF